MLIFKQVLFDDFYSMLLSSLKTTSSIEIIIIILHAKPILSIQVTLHTTIITIQTTQNTHITQRHPTPSRPIQNEIASYCFIAKEIPNQAEEVGCYNFFRLLQFEYQTSLVFRSMWYFHEAYFKILLFKKQILY